MNRNNTNETLPENNTGKDVEAVEKTHAIKMAKQRVAPGNEMRTHTATLDNFPTNKLDPTIGSTREKNQDRNPTANDVEHIEIQQRRALKVDKGKGALRYKTGR
jgi:hypothetical protein